MSKKVKIILIAAMLVSVMLLACACQSFKWGPVGSTDGTAEAENNGFLVVKQGSSLYYVNGMDATTSVTKPEDNYFGKAPVKGQIMKSTINDDGSLSDTAVVVPKMFYTGYTSAGLYIFGDWIYYATPSIKTDNQGTLDSALEYMRTKTDGSKTQSIAEISGTTTPYVFTSECLIYYANSEIHRVTYTDKKVGKDTVVASDVTSALITNNCSKVFFVQDPEEDYFYASRVSMFDGVGEVSLLMDKTTFVSDTSESAMLTNLAQQYTVSLMMYNKAEDALYYTKTANDNAAAAGTYAYKFNGTYSIDKSLEKKYAISALTAFSTLGFEQGLLDTSAAAAVIYKPIESTANINNKEDFITFSAVATVMFFETIDDVDYVYYLMSGLLYRINYKAEKPVEEKISDETVTTSWINATRLGNYFYYLDVNESSYLYRFDYKSYKNEANDLVMPEGRMVSGYAEYTYPEDADYTMPNDEIPMFMTDADKETYVTNHKVTE